MRQPMQKNWFSIRRFPFYKQLDAMDCGPTCLRMIAEHYGKRYSLQSLRAKSFVTRAGVSLLGLNEAAETIGLRALAARMPLEKLDEVPLPCIAHWRHNHFVVVHKVSRRNVYVADPAHGLLTYPKEEFLKRWRKKAETDEGVVLLLEPTPAFYQQENEADAEKTSFRFLLTYLAVHKNALLRVVVFMLVGSLIQISLPFLTQAIVDRGIANQDVRFVYLILLAQFTLYAGRTVADFVRSRILLHVGTRINIAIISDFLTKLMRLPLACYDSKMIGDLLQRVNDHYRIETFLTSTLLSALFSTINLVAFGVALAIYNRAIFAIFVLGSILYAAWILFFLKKRRDLDYKRFDQLAENQNTLIQLVRGMPEIKLNSAEEQKRAEWQQIQEKLYRINVDSLTLNQYQQGGARFINELKNIIIVFVAASAVIAGDMTLGMMMAVQFIVGQLNSPLMQILSFVQSAQDARIGLERLGEIHNQRDEERNGNRITTMPEARSLSTRHLSFQYEGPHSPQVLQDVTLHIPSGQVTAIVGPSGSGKTTLLKLLLKFYEPTRGNVQLGDVDLWHIDSKAWRRQCGVVMQEGYIFSDTIARNIALSDGEVDVQTLRRAAAIANIQSFIESLPLGYETKIGQDGHDLSRGQKQRILIARAVYKDPAYLFFDEATNALDASNERTIMESLADFFRNKTVVVIAHRLSTVQKADQIVVLDGGRIVERGTHAELTAARGAYYHLVRDQLEMGS